MAPLCWPPRDAAHLMVSGPQMAELEQVLFANGMPVEALMEKAALAISRRLQQPDVWPDLQSWGALVLVGPGHNGGDGLVIARELHLAGIAVRIWCPFERRKPLTESHLRQALWLGIPKLEGTPEPSDPALWIDALFGIGQSRPPGAELEQLLLERQRQLADRLIAIDGPTGLCSDRGVPLGQAAATAQLTLSIGLIKQGFVQDSALAWVGDLERIELGLPRALLEALPPNQTRSLGAADLSSAPWPTPAAAAAKYKRGRLLLIAGSDAYRGAALLSLEGASASGAGSLRAAVPEAVADQLWCQLPHAVLSARLPSHSNGSLDLRALPPSALERLDAVVLGPGIGNHPGDDGIWEQLQTFPGLLVLDADGLNRLAQRPAVPWLLGRRGPTWLTPHGGEFQRIFPDLSGQPALEACAAAAQRSGCSVLLKGARSVIADPTGERWQLSSACSHAARAGLGDVLAGYAGGLGALALASGATAGGSLLALAALAHAAAGQRASEQHGIGGATPSRIAEILAAMERKTKSTIVNRI
ncbi:NAD(P)H-hydrate dehydratase [Synechococcus sp. A10-1-5-1]|uniref:NAD(P)H-hydrate dehydratase n=1 Tax=Synechococcus sp. A10-1-5-1 TaxID=2936507 RepID=UPI0020014EA6|nr:NAD(P)H-hydrate dehydratase [Synechococcus sp. A10-1-5-1]UPM49946.1 NAD(P)H-hydrate dehydratase [Synechococcus sp. A10-1-5-1]